MYEERSFFFEKNGRLMQNHRIGMDNEKICIDTATQNTRNTSQFVWPQSDQVD